MCAPGHYLTNKPPIFFDGFIKSITFFLKLTYLTYLSTSAAKSLWAFTRKPKNLATKINYSMMKISFIQTGGTIDKDYPRSTKGWAFEIAEPAVTRILEKLNPSFDYEVFSVLKKDSLEITDDDRQQLLDFCRKLDSDKIIITHGTDTMIETGRYLSNLKNKVIILTGAMRPERFANSDAAITVGTAIGAVNVLTEGVFVAMHGVVIAVDKVQRNLKDGRFI